jgi:Predicted dehydrogenases and related proteins
LQKVKSQYTNIYCFSSIEESLEYDFDAYIIATPAITHTELAKIIISNNKPVLVEKPLSLSLSESKEIKSHLIDNNGKLIVGHLLLFHPAIQKIKTMINNGEIGKIQYIYSNRLNLGTIRKEENVFWSFAPHDIALFQFFSNSFPDKVDSMGGDFLQKNIHDTTITYLKYPNGIQGHIYVSWLHPFKEHRLVVIGSKGSLHFEDSLENKPLLYYEKVDSRSEDLLSPRNKLVKQIEYESILPLEKELIYFFDIIKGKPINIANIDEGIDVIKILEMATKSLNS